MENSPQASCGIVEDIRVRYNSRFWVISIWPTRVGDKNGLCQWLQGVSDQQGLQLVIGGQVPQQTYNSQNKLEWQQELNLQGLIQNPL